MMRVQVTGSSSELERRVRTKVQDLDSLAANLRMHDGFVRTFNELQPLLEELGGRAAQLGRAANDRFVTLMAEYDRVGKPISVDDESTRLYFEMLRDFGRFLHDNVLALYPLEERVVYSGGRGSAKVPTSPYRR